MSIEIDALSRLLSNPTEVSIFIENDIGEKHFLDPNNLAAYRFIFGFYRKYDTLPNALLVESRTGMVTVDANEPMQWYCDELIRREIFIVVRDGLGTISKALESGEITEARDLLRDLTGEAQSIGKPSGVLSVGAVDGRVEKYREMKATPGYDGIPTGWDYLNEETYGFHKGEFWLYLARTGVGKTWAKLISAMAAWKAGYRVLFFGMEMSTEALSRRFDALYARVDYDQLRKGKLDLYGEKRYLEAMEELRDSINLNFIGAEMGSTTSAFEAAIQRFEPDAAYVDGIYLMTPTGWRGGPNHEKMKMLSDDVAMVAHRRKIPIIASNQFNRDIKKKSEEADATAIAGSDALGQNAHGLLGFLQTEEMEEDKEMLLDLFKHREGRKIKFKVNWNFDAADFTCKSRVGGFGSENEEDDLGF